MAKRLEKLGSDKNYKRPKKTYQEQLSAQDIAEKLQGYRKVDSLIDVPIDTHIRYFKTEDDGTRVFRTGGFLRNKNNANQYIILSNGKKTWSVQVEDTVFFSKMTHKEEIDAIHEDYRSQLDAKDKIIERLERKLEEANSRIKKLGTSTRTTEKIALKNNRSSSINRRSDINKRSRS